MTQALKSASFGEQSLAAWIRQHSKDRTQERATALESVPLVVSRIANSVGGEGSSGDEFAQIIGRFGDLGLAPGETFDYFGRAPLGEPVFICVRETVLALRMEEAALIFVAATSQGDLA